MKVEDPEMEEFLKQMEEEEFLKDPQGISHREKAFFD